MIKRLLLAAALGAWIASCGSVSPGSSQHPGDTAARLSPAQRSSPVVARLIAGARREGGLTLLYFSGGADEEMRALTRAFHVYYGLDIAIDNTPQPDQASLAARLAQEHQAGKRASTDVYFGVGVYIENLKSAGVLKLGALDGLPNAGPRVEDGVAVAFRTDLPGITYNTTRVSGRAVPRVLGDVLRLPASVRVASTPYASTLAGMPWYVGADRAIAFNVKLAHRIKGLILCGEESRIISGEFHMLVTDCGQFAAKRLKAQGAPIDQIVPRDLAVLSPSFAAVPANAPHPNAARLWVDFLLSRPAQDILWRYDGADNVHLPGSRQVKVAAGLRRQGVRFHDIGLLDFVRHADLNGAQDCIQSVLNLRFDAPACRPFRGVVDAS